MSSTQELVEWCKEERDCEYMPEQKQMYSAIIAKLLAAEKMVEALKWVTTPYSNGEKKICGPSSRSMCEQALAEWEATR